MIFREFKRFTKNEMFDFDFPNKINLTPTKSHVSFSCNKDFMAKSKFEVYYQHLSDNGESKKIIIHGSTIVGLFPPET